MRCLLYSEETDQHAELKFPATGAEIQFLCDELRIKNTAKAEVTIITANLMDKEIDTDIFQEKIFVIDELNFLSKQLTLLTLEEREIFSRMSLQNDLEMHDMIELSENVHQMKLMDNKPNLINVAKQLALLRNPDLNPEEIHFSQQKANQYLCDFTMKQESLMIEDGRLLYEEKNWTPFFSGNCLPPTIYECPPLSVELFILGNCSETINLPYYPADLDKTLERFGITDKSQLDEVGIRIFTVELNPSLQKFLCNESLSVDSLPDLNFIAEHLQELSQNNGKELYDMMEKTSANTLTEVALIAKNFDDLCFYENIESERDFGEHLVQQNSELDFDWKFSEYIDFTGIGISELEDLTYTFLNDGLLTYSGNDLDICELMDKAQEQIQTTGGMSY
ncbi:MAG: antirestriction protein ArdA [Eubacteriales bacterium]